MKSLRRDGALRRRHSTTTGRSQLSRRPSGGGRRGPPVGSRSAASKTEMHSDACREAAARTLRTTSMPSRTLPKTTCLPSSQGVGTVVISSRQAAIEALAAVTATGRCKSTSTVAKHFAEATTAATRRHEIGTEIKRGNGIIAVAATPADQRQQNRCEELRAVGVRPGVRLQECQKRGGKKKKKKRN
jgi:hypothetical protein